MNHMDIFNELEEKRLERLRNLLTPFLLLPELVKDNNYPDSLKIDTADTCLKILPLIHKALSEDITLDELHNLYL